MRDPKNFNIIKEWWSQDNLRGSKMFIFVSKFKKGQAKLKECNKLQFKDIFAVKEEIKVDLQSLGKE